MHKLLAIAAITASLGGCAAISTITGATVPGNTVQIAIGSFNTIETVATGYLYYCVATPKAAVCAANIRHSMRANFEAGYKQAKAFTALLRANPGTGIPVANYNTFETEITTLQNIISTYNLASVVKG